MCAHDDFELGRRRAEVLRLIHELRTLRGVSHDQVLSAVMASDTYRRMGSPALQDLTLAQAQALLLMLGRWRDQAGTRPPRPRREASHAPPAPWRRNDH